MFTFSLFIFLQYFYFWRIIYNVYKVNNPLVQYFLLKKPRFIMPPAQQTNYLSLWTQLIELTAYQMLKSSFKIITTRKEIWKYRTVSANLENNNYLCLIKKIILYTWLYIKLIYVGIRLLIQIVFRILFVYLTNVSFRILKFFHFWWQNPDTPDPLIVFTKDTFDKVSSETLYYDPKNDFRCVKMYSIPEKAQLFWFDDSDMIVEIGTIRYTLLGVNIIFFNKIRNRPLLLLQSQLMWWPVVELIWIFLFSEFLTAKKLFKNNVEPFTYRWVSSFNENSLNLNLLNEQRWEELYTSLLDSNFWTKQEILDEIAKYKIRPSIKQSTDIPDQNVFAKECFFVLELKIHDQSLQPNLNFLIEWLHTMRLDLISID